MSAISTSSATRRRPDAYAADVFEAKDFSNLTHWQSLAWHGAPRDSWRDTVPSVNDCSRTAPPPDPSGVAGMRRNQWLASVGITGWNGSESPAGLRRNTQIGGRQVGAMQVGVRQIGISQVGGRQVSEI